MSNQPAIPTMANGSGNPETLCAAIDRNAPAYKPMSPAIALTSSFFFDDFDEYARVSSDEFNSFSYTRGANPTCALVEQKLAELEGGEKCRLFSSGMGAISATLFTFLGQGDHVLLINTVYGASVSLIREFGRFGVECTLLDSCNTAEIAAAMQPNTRVVYFESPSSQRFEMIDLAAVADAAHARGAMTIMDATWASPVFQHPLDHGIDVVIHSCSKYIGGHSDVLGGAIISSASNLERIERCGYLLLGATCSPVNASLMLRGLRTLPIRMRAFDAHVRYVLDVLKDDPRIKRIHHPYCGDAWQQKLVTQYLSGYGSLFGIDMADPDLEKMKTFVNSLKVVTLGVSWGGFESLALPVFKGDNKDAIVRRGLDPTHVRMYVGLEDPDDVAADIERALDIAYGAR